MAGTAAGWVQALDWLGTLEHQHLVPGHGPIQGADSTAVAELGVFEGAPGFPPR